MNIDKPQCNLKTCRYCHDYNCFGQYETCEYTLAKNGRPHGEWVENTRYKRKGKKFLDCSRCHYGENGDVICEVSKLPNYCPNCGALMTKEALRKYN